MISDNKKGVEKWINEDPALKEYIQRSSDLYKGPIQFIRVGKKRYQAKLDCDKLNGCCKGALEAFFELNLTRKKNGTYTDFFFLKIVTDKHVNTIKLY
jgi:hypothetical protein